MKTLKMLICALTLSFVFSVTGSAAMPSSLKTEEYSHYDEETGYYETITTTVSFSFPIRKAYASQTPSTKTVTREVRVTDAAQALLWNLSLTATFSYDGSTSKCISCSHSASAPGNGWSIQSSSSSKSGNTAYATATAVHKLFFLSKTTTKNLSISCTPAGEIQ